METLCQKKNPLSNSHSLYPCYQNVSKTGTNAFVILIISLVVTSNYMTYLFKMLLLLLLILNE